MVIASEEDRDMPDGSNYDYSNVGNCCAAVLLVLVSHLSKASQ